jgi:hypothetical protein
MVIARLLFAIDSLHNQIEAILIGVSLYALIDTTIEKPSNMLETARNWFSSSLHTQAWLMNSINLK